MKYLLYLSFLFALLSCDESRSIAGYDKAQWTSFNSECTNYRLAHADLIIENRETVIGANQTEVERLLGPATEHELYARNQKFFHYRLTPHDSCTTDRTTKYLSIRFNALGNANDVQIVIRE